MLKSPLNHYGVRDIYEEGVFHKMVQEQCGGESHLTKLVYNLDERLFDRLYLEFCAGGDLGVQIQERNRSRVPFEEVELWKMFVCLARASVAIAKPRIVQ